MESKRKWILFKLMAAVFVVVSPFLGAQDLRGAVPEDTLVVVGVITNAQGKGIKDAALDFYLDGHKLEDHKEIFSGSEGNYQAEIKVPSGKFRSSRVAVEITKPVP